MFFKKSQRQNSIAYFEVRDALREAGCPICHLLVTRSVAALDSLLYEQVTDPDTRDGCGPRTVCVTGMPGNCSTSPLAVQALPLSTKPFSGINSLNSCSSNRRSSLARSGSDSRHGCATTPPPLPQSLADKGPLPYLSSTYVP